MSVVRMALDNSVYKIQAKARANGGKIIMVGMPTRQDHIADARAIRCVAALANRPDAFSYEAPSPFAAEGRNQIIRYAKLKVPEISHILFIDADTILPENALDELLAHDKDIVTAVQPLVIAGRGIVWNVMPYEGGKARSFIPINYGDLPDKLFRIETCGFGTILVKRKVIEKMEWPYFKDIFTQHKWAMGQDIYFISKAQRCGFEIWADPNLQCEHSKKTDLLSLATAVYGNRKSLSDLRPSLYLEMEFDKDELSLIKEAKIMSRGFATHLPVIASVMSHTSGLVLELGCGFGSTPLLHQMCLSAKRELFSCDNSARWIKDLSRYGTNGHTLLAVENWDKCEVFDKEWDVAFIDHKPIRQRAKALQRLANKAQYIICHDTDSSLFGYEPVFDKFKYRYDFKDLRPWSTVVSNFNSLDFLKGE